MRSRRRARCDRLKNAAFGIDLRRRESEPEPRLSQRCKSPAIDAPEPKIARGMVRRGSRISSLIIAAISRPVKANANCGQKFTVSQSQ